MRIRRRGGIAEHLGRIDGVCRLVALHAPDDALIVDKQLIVVVRQVLIVRSALQPWIGRSNRDDVQLAGRVGQRHLLPVRAPVAVDVRDGIRPLSAIRPAVCAIEHLDRRPFLHVPQHHLARVARRHRQPWVGRMAKDHVHGLGMHAGQPPDDLAAIHHEHNDLKRVRARQQQTVVRRPGHLVDAGGHLPPPPRAMLLLALRGHERRLDLPRLSCMGRETAVVPLLPFPDAHHAVP